MFIQKQAKNSSKREGNYFHNQREKVKQLLQVFCQREGKRDRTYKSYKKWNLLFLNFIKKNYTKVSTKDIQAFLDNEIERGLGARTLKLIKASLKYFYGNILEYQIGQLKTPRLKPGKERDFPTREQIQIFIDTAKTKRDKLIIKTLYSTALRNFELRELLIEDFDFFKMRNVNSVRDGKGGKPGEFIISTKLLIQLKEFVGQRKKGYLFLNKYKKKMSEQAIQRMIQKVRKIARMEKQFTPHSFRHSFATHLYEDCKNMKIIKEVLRHTSIKTSDCYVHNKNKILKDVKNPLDNIENFQEKIPKKKFKTSNNKRDQNMITELLLENRKFRIEIEQLIKENQKQKTIIQQLQNRFRGKFEEQKGYNSF